MIAGLALFLEACNPTPVRQGDLSEADAQIIERGDTRGDPSSGEQIALTWCTPCHLTSAGQQGSDVGPTWSAIGNDPKKTDDYLRSFLTNPHGQMQGISLTRQQISDVIAYIRKLGE